MDKFYITTAIPYVNAKPHLGHALEFVQADVIARYQKTAGKEVFLTTGADENSLKNVQAAEKLGISTQELCNRNSELFKKFAQTIGLSFSTFMRSSNPDLHLPGIKKLWNACVKNGDIYKKRYKGLYCVGCEAFYTEDELVDGLCPEHLTKPEVVEEENYFFTLSKYQRKLIELIEGDSLLVYPESRKNEVLSFVKSGLKDFSVSRSSERAKDWGLSVPGDASQKIYVWFDALGIYLTGVGFGRDENLFKKWWPADVHVIGKGIIRFHAVYWPAMLLSAGLELPRKIFVHDYVTVEGQKMSKSLGNVVDPMQLLERYPVDAVRYFLIRESPAWKDADFSEAALRARIDGELVADLANLVARILTIAEKTDVGSISGAEELLVHSNVDKVRKSMEDFDMYGAINEIWAVIRMVNKYINDTRPWEAKGAALGKILYNALEAIRIIAILIQPFMPSTSERIFEQLGVQPQPLSEARFKRFEGRPKRGKNLFERAK